MRAGCHAPRTPSSVAKLTTLSDRCPLACVTAPSDPSIASVCDPLGARERTVPRRSKALQHRPQRPSLCRRSALRSQNLADDFLRAAEPNAFVRFDRNLYSVPPAFAHKTLTLCASDTDVRMLDADTQVAEYSRHYGLHQILENPAHREEIAPPS